MAQGLPRVIIREVKDISTRIVPRGGDTTALVFVNALRGPVDTPTYVFSETEYLRKFAVADSIGAGEDKAHYAVLSFLREGRSALIVRPEATSAMVANLNVTSGGPHTEGSGVTVANVPDEGEATGSDPLEVYAKNAGAWGNKVSVKFVANDLDGGVIGTQDLAVSETTDGNDGSADWDGDNTNDSRKFTIEDGDVTVGAGTVAKIIDNSVSLTVGTTEYTRVTDTSTAIGDDEFAWDAENGDIIVKNGDALTGGVISFSVGNSPDAVEMQVYFDYSDDNDLPVETFVVSYKKDVRDGFGRTVFAENAAVDSEYVTVRVPASAAALPYVMGASDDPVSLGGGDDGTLPADAAKASDTAEYFLELQDRHNYPYDLILTGGNTDATFRDNMLTLAEARKVTSIVTTVPTADQAPSSILANYVNDADKPNEDRIFVYTPDIRIYDQFNDRSLEVACDGVVAGMMARARRETGRPWTVPAGPTHGLLEGFGVLDLKYRYTESRAGNLYDGGVNPIIFRPGRGYVVQGQKTSLSRPSFLDRINVRLLVDTVNGTLADFLEEYEFVPNTAANRATITSRVESYMEFVRTRDGIKPGFQVICNDTNNLPIDIDNGRMNVWVIMTPVSLSEYITLQGVLTRTGASFQEVQAVAA